MGNVVRKAVHIGRGHLLNKTNRQDACILFDGDVNNLPVVIGIVCDGCSEGTSSEVGATLASEFMVRETMNLLKKGVAVDIAPHVLYGRLIEFLRSQLNCGYDFIDVADQVSFVKDHLLFTTVGFILTDSDCIVFVAGDGTVIINDDVHIIEQSNKPMYPAYHLVNRTFLQTDVSELPTSFQLYHPNRAELRRLAIGSDSWHDERELLSEVWGYKHPKGLQRKINVWSEVEKHFYDDVSIITVEISEE